MILYVGLTQQIIIAQIYSDITQFKWKLYDKILFENTHFIPWTFPVFEPWTLSFQSYCQKVNLRKYCSLTFRYILYLFKK